MIKTAIISGSVSRSSKKRISVNDYFEAEKARKDIINESVNEKPRDLTRYKKAMSSLSNFEFKNT